MYFIGIDIGTSSVKALVMDETGNVIKTTEEKYPISYPYPLWAQQDPRDWWNMTLKALQTLLVDIPSGDIASLGLSGQMHGLVLLDENDCVIRPAILWNDQRSHQECHYLNEEIGQSKLLEWTGNIALPGFTAPKLLWVKNNEPQNFQRIRKIMLPKDYIAYRLTGNFATDFSDASGTLYMDVKNRTWSSPMLDILGISSFQLPQILPSTSSIGIIKKELAVELAINPNTKIVIGGGDQAMGAVGSSILEEGQGSISLGTSGALFIPCDTFAAVPQGQLHSFCDATGKYHVMGVTLSAASSLEWYAKNILSHGDISELLSEAQLSNINESVYFLPYLCGERTPHNDPLAKAGFIGLNISHERKDVTRSILEGVAFSMNDSLELVRALGITVENLTVHGGGSKSDFWCQMLADVLRCTVSKNDSNNGPSYGAALVAAAGYWGQSLTEIPLFQKEKWAKTFIPDPQKSSHYQEKYLHYKQLYPLLKDFFHQI